MIAVGDSASSVGAGSGRSAEPGASDDRQELVALLLLQELPGIGPATVARVLDFFGSARASLEAKAATFSRVAGPRAGAARAGEGRRQDAERALEQCAATGTRIVPRGHPTYPERLLHLAHPPALLFLRGDPGLLELPAVAIVGSRRSTGYGRRVAAEAARVLARHGVVVSSGLALGIDGAAHRAALEDGGPSLAVLGAGVDVPHPPSNRRLFQRLAREGLLVSEFLPGVPPLPHHFPRRNRILAALSEGVLVVEAAERSGALITADLAVELGREVMAVPGSVFAPQSRGANALLRVGAAPMTDPADVLGLVRSPLRPAGDRAPASSVGPRLAGDQAAAWAVLGSDGKGLDDLVRVTGLPADRVLAALCLLEIAGWAEREPGMRFRRRSEWA